MSELMMPTSALEVDWNEGAIDSKYDIIAIKSGRGKYALVADPVEDYVGGESIVSVCNEVGGRTYVMMRKSAGNERGIAEYARNKDADAKVSAVPARTMAAEHPRQLLQLFFNRVSYIDRPGLRSNNLSGHMYLTRDDWVSKGKDSLKALEIKVGEFGKQRLLVASASAVRFVQRKYVGKKYYDKLRASPHYSYRAGKLRREFSDDDSLYVRKGTRTKASIRYLVISPHEEFQWSREYLLADFIRRAGALSKDCLSLRTAEMKVTAGPINMKDSAKEGLRDRVLGLISGRTLGIWNIDRDDETEKLCKGIADFLRGMGIDPIAVGSSEDADFTIAVCHSREYYEEEKLEDPYRPGPSLQHITAESVKDPEDIPETVIDVLLKELVIKKGLEEGRDLIGQWSGRLHPSARYTFIRRVDDAGSRSFDVYAMTIDLGGRLECHEADRKSPEFRTVTELWRNYDDNRSCSRAVIDGAGNIACIHETGAVPLIDNRRYGDILDSGAHGPEGPKGKDTKRDVLFPVLGLKTMEYRGNMYYSCGADPNLNKYISKAPRIRMVESIGEPFFDELVEEMNVPFVRYKQTTVYPYPFKYLDEYVRMQDKENSESGEDAER